MRRRISRPSPALVISLVALFVALGGTGYAATQLAKNSVGAKHLKKNAVSGAKVKNSSLLLNDFRASERSKLHGAPGARGAAGARGATGARGLQGVQGIQGTQGTPGAQGTQGIQGPPGAAGTDGDPGPQGDPGPPGPTGVEEVVVRTASFSFPVSNGITGQVLSGDAQCQSGESVVGGGSNVAPTLAVGGQPNVIITINRPADGSGAAPLGGTEPRGWFVEARRNSDGAGHSVTVYVLCASEGA